MRAVRAFAAARRWQAGLALTLAGNPGQFLLVREPPLRRVRPHQVLNRPRIHHFENSVHLRLLVEGVVHPDQPAGAGGVRHHDAQLGNDLVTLLLGEDGHALDRDQHPGLDVPGLVDGSTCSGAQLLKHLEVVEAVNLKAGRAFIE